MHALDSCWNSQGELLVCLGPFNYLLALNSFYMLELSVSLTSFLFNLLIQLQALVLQCLFPRPSTDAGIEFRRDSITVGHGVYTSHAVRHKMVGATVGIDATKRASYAIIAATRRGASNLAGAQTQCPSKISRLLHLSRQRY